MTASDKGRIWKQGSQTMKKKLLESGGGGGRFESRPKCLSQRAGEKILWREENRVSQTAASPFLFCI